MSGFEIERKFLVRKDKDFKSLAFSSSRIKQGYIAAKGATVRVRVRDDKGYLTIKEPSRDGGLNRYEFEKDVHMQRLVKYIDHIICAEDSEKHKPDPDPMYAYMRKAGCTDPAGCIFIGDTMHDCQCATGADCDFALADWQHRGLQEIPARYHFTEINEILGLL